MSARATLSFAVFCAALLSACGDDSRSPARAPQTASAALAAGAAKGFNVLLVTFDTVRADALGCYGEKNIRTPTIDALAARGVRFQRALAPTPITLPSHSTLMTGLDPLSHGVRNNGTFQLAAEHTTLAERLAAVGYDTAAIVASFVLDARYGMAQGFAQYDDDVHVDGVAAGEGHFRERKAAQVTERALSWLGARDTTRPFFLWTHYFDAHAPHQAPAPFALTGADADPSAPFSYELYRKRYLAEIAYADSELGRLLRGLGDEQLARTLVVFTADHGEGLGEHGEFTHSRLIYDSTMRVPLILSCPSLFSSASLVSDRVVGLVDVAPTVLELLGLDAGERSDGQSMFTAEPDSDRAIYGESMVTLYNHGWAPLHSLSRLRDKGIRAPRPEFYDVQADPGELRNLHDAQREKSQALLSRISVHLAKGPASAPRETQLEVSVARELDQLGYSRSSSGGSALGTIDPKDAITSWAVLSNAQTFAAQGQTDRALADIARVLASNPNDPFAWESIYVVREKRGEFAEAEVALLKVVELNPSSESLVRLAWLCFKQSKFVECEAAMARAKSLEPEHGDLFLLRGELLFREQRYAAAREQFELALKVDPARTDEKARRGIGAVEAAQRGGQ